MNVDRASFLFLTTVLAAASAGGCSSSGSDVGSGGQAATLEITPACTDPDATVAPVPFQEGTCFDLADPLSDPGGIEGHPNPDRALLAQCHAYAALLKPAVAAEVEACMRAARDAGGLAHPLTTATSAECASKALQNVCEVPEHPSAETICFGDIGPAFEGYETNDFVIHECVETFSGLTDAGAEQVKQCMLGSLPGADPTGITSATQALASCIASMKPQAR